MAAPQLLPEDFDTEDIEEELVEEPEDYEEEIEYEEPDDDRSDRLDELKEKGKEKLKEKREQKRQAKEQEKLRTDESKKPPKQEPEKPELKENRNAKAQKEADKVKSGRQKLDKATGDKAVKGGEKAAKTAGKTAGKEAAAAGKQGAKQATRAAAKATAQATKAAAQAAAQGARAAAAATVEIWGPVLIIVVIIAVIIAIIFVLFSFSGDTGKGPAVYPETALQQQQSNFLLAISGDKIAQDTIVKDVIESELERYDRIKTNTDRYDPSLSAGVAEKKSVFETSLNSILAEQDTQARKDLKDQIEREMKAYESTLPFGRWITAIAKDNVGQKNIGFCKITGAGAKVACASFTTTVLYIAGVPNAIQPSVDKIWEQSFYQTIFDKPENKDAANYAKIEPTLQPGDLIFWGDGDCADGGSVKFDHVGFYVGDGQAIDTSSSAEVVKQRPAAKRGDCRVFNGAKRYGK